MGTPTGIMNSSEDYKEMGKTPASDKASKMLDKEYVSGGLNKKSCNVFYKERTDAGRSAKTIPDTPQTNGFDPMSRGF